MSAKPVLDLAVRVAVAVAVFGGGWHWYRAFGLVFAMPVLAIFAVPLINGTGALPRLAARLALRHYEGRYYAYRDRHVDIDIDPDGTCWVATADARKILPALPSDPVLARLQRGQVRETGDPRAWRITPQALAAVLEKALDPETARFVQWLDRQVVRPARQRLERGMPVR